MSEQMSVEEALRADLKEATKAKDERLKNVIRMTISALKNAAIEKGKALSYEDEVEVVAKQVKLRKDSIDEFRKVGREDAAAEAQAEIDILMKYLPRQLSEDEVRAMAREVAAQVGAVGPKDLGKVMGPLMAKVKGRADGKMVNRIVREVLGG